MASATEVDGAKLRCHIDTQKMTLVNAGTLSSTLSTEAPSFWYSEQLALGTAISHQSMGSPVPARLPRSCAAYSPKSTPSRTVT